MLNHLKKPLPRTSTSKLKYRLKWWLSFLLSWGLLLFSGSYYAYSKRQQYVRENQVVWVVVTRQDISAPSLINEQQVRLKPFPRKYLPDQFFKETRLTIGRLITQDVTKGEIITPHNFGPSGDPTSISAQFQEHFAFTLDEEWLIARLPELKPHDHIDILASHPKDPSQETMLLVERAEVIEIQNTKSRKKTLVLNLTQTQAQSLLAARGMGLPMQILVHSSL